MNEPIEIQSAVAKSTFTAGEVPEGRLEHQFSDPKVVVMTPATKEDQPSHSSTAVKSTLEKDFKTMLQHPYEFEKISLLDGYEEYIPDTEQDKQVVETFRPRRQYLATRSRHQQRRSSLPTTASEKLSRTGATATGSVRQHHNEKQKSTTTAFEWKRRKQEHEEGELYATTRATERASREWNKHSTIIRPRNINDAKEERDEKRRLVMLALLEKDASKSNLQYDNTNNNSSSSSNNLSASLSALNWWDVDPSEEPSESTDHETLEELVASMNQVTAGADAQPLKEEPTVNVKSEEVEGTKKKQTKTKKKASIKEKDPERRKQLKLLKNALRKAASLQEPALRSLIRLAASKEEENLNNSEEKKKRQSKRHSLSTGTPRQEVKAAKQKSSNGKRHSSKARSSDKKVSAAPPKSPKKNMANNRRALFTRRSSAPDLLVSALTTVADTPEEALKEFSNLPKHLLADIMTDQLPPPTRPAETTTKSAATTKKSNHTKSPSKQRKTRRTSLPNLMKEYYANKNDDITNSTSSRRSSLPTTPTPVQPDVIDDTVVYDFESAAKEMGWKHITVDLKKHSNNSNHHHHHHHKSKSPKKTKKETAPSCLPNLEALLPLVGGPEN